LRSTRWNPGDAVREEYAEIPARRNIAEEIAALTGSRSGQNNDVAPGIRAL
jgi:hypothetical protein